MTNWRERYSSWALVTGASSGLGADFCRQLAERGMNIILVARRAQRLTALADEISSKFGLETLEIPQDLADSYAVERIVAAVDDRQVGVLVNNAGFGLAGYFHEQSHDRHSEMVRLNCLVPVELTQKFLPPMLERGKGAIIFVASTAAYQPTPFFSVYGATKAFNLFLGEALWEEYRKQGIDVLALCPGRTETEFRQVAGVAGSYGAGTAQSPDVVSLALENLGRVPSLIHGRRNRFLAFIQRLAPRKLVLKVTGIVMAKRRIPKD